MGRKKSVRGKNKKEELEQEEVGENRFDLNIDGDIKRSVVAVFLFALAIVLLLGFFDKAGVVGKYLAGISGKAIGWTKWIFPIFLVVAGVVLLIKKKTSFYVYKILGLFVILVSVSGFFHWFYSLKEMSKMAKAGSGGGYLGYGVSYFSINYFGSAGGLVLIIFLMLCGFILAFNFSLIKIISRFRDGLKEEGSDEEQSDEEETLPDNDTEKISETAKDFSEQKENVDEKGNIAKIKFVEGNDQYVDEEALNNMCSERGSKSSLNSRKSSQRKGKKGQEASDKWELPPLDLLEVSSGEPKGGNTEKNAEIIENTLENFGINVERGEIKVGPSVTQYSFRPAVGVKISKILGLQNDIALALAAHPIRIEAPIPGKSLIGIEVPNKVSAMVRLRDILESNDFSERSSDLALVLGRDVSGSAVLANLDKMPHLMIAGATGTGKSVSINSVITTLLYQNSPRDLKMIMVDPKRVELSLYNGIPHLLSDVIVENGKVVNALRWAVSEMEKRYRLFQDVGSRDILSYRDKVEKGEKRKYTDQETGEIIEEPLENLPYIVIIIDELADLMGSHGKEVEGAIVRLAQMARAVGIHLIVSTQRPSVEVITGLIKANITTRIAFQVASQIDSRTILDMAGAEKLIGNGDLLFLSAASPKPRRIQGAYVSESEVKRVVKFIKEQKYENDSSDDDVEEEIQNNGKASSQVKLGGGLQFDDVDSSNQEDELFEAAKEEVIRMGKASASLLQRRLRIGYARAARILDELEEKGLIGPAEGAKPREVYGSSDNNQIPEYEDTNTDQEKRDKWEM